MGDMFSKWPMGMGPQIEGKGDGSNSRIDSKSSL